jgi:hypothetical protein
MRHKDLVKTLEIMPDLGYSPYQDAAQGVSKLGNVIQGLALDLARQRFQQQLLQQQMQLRQLEAAQQGQLYRQHGELYNAQTALADANRVLMENRAKDLEKAASIRGQLGEDLSAFPLFQEGLQKDALIGRILGGIGQTARPDRVPVNIAQMMALRDPVQAAALGQGGGFNKLYQNVGPGVTAIPGVEGLPGMVGAMNVPQGAMSLPPRVITGTDVTDIGEAQYGVPPRQTSRELDLRALLGSNQDLLGKLMTLGQAPLEGSPTYPIYSNTTNQIAQIQQLLGAQLARQQAGTNVAPVVAPPSVAPPPQLLDAPRDPTQRKAGQVYNTPRGPLKWTGTGWIQP